MNQITFRRPVSVEVIIVRIGSFRWPSASATRTAPWSRACCSPGCGKAARYDAATSAWQRIQRGPLDETIYSKAYKDEVQVWRSQTSCLLTPLS
jgi:hypothetical protein